jgi:hypothetical protein
MTFLIGMPGGSEWVLIIITLVFLLTMPILAIVFYTRNRELKKQIATLTNEKNALLAKLLDSK